MLAHFLLHFAPRCRLLPVLFGSDLEDDEEAEANSPYLLRSAGDSRPKALPAAARRRLLTDGSQEPSEDAKGKGGQGETDGVLVAAAKKGEGEVDDGEVVVVSRRVSKSECPIASMGEPRVCRWCN